MSSDMIKCQICGAAAHVIKNHLIQIHGSGSEQPCTEAEYQQRFPEAPMLSKKALSRIAEIKAKKTGTQKSSAPAIDPKAERAPLATLFNLGDAKDAKTKSGKDIMIKVCHSDSFDELVPEMDPNYVYDIETLKVVLMGIENNIPTYIYGHAGVGKSSLFEQVCGATKRRMLRIQHTVNTEESHIVGQWTVKRNKDETTGDVVSETVFELGPLPLAMINGWTFLADEYDRSYPSVLSVYQAVLEGKALYIKEADAANRMIKPHPDFRFVATGNTNGAGDDTGMYQATVQQDAATFERFGVVLKVNYMDKVKETEIVRLQSGVNDEHADKIIDYVNRVRAMHPSELSLTIGPRVAINIARIGLMRGDFKKGVEIAFANRLPEAERSAAIQVAQRLFG